MRWLDGLIEDFRARLSRGGEGRVAGAGVSPAAETEGLCVFFLAADGSRRLHACRTSEFAVEMASHGLRAPKVGLVEDREVFLDFREGYAKALALEGCDVILWTRANELIREMAWLSQAVDAGAAEVRCAFDFDAEGLAYFLVAGESLGDRCRVAWPAEVDGAFARRRAEGGVALADGSKLASDNPDALRWARLLVEHGVAVRQREFLV